MIRWLIPLLFLTGCRSTPRLDIDPDSDRTTAAVLAVVEEYVSAWRAADSERLARILDPAGVVHWISGEGSDSQVDSMSFSKLLARESRPQPSYGLQTRVVDLEVVDDQLATVRIEISRSGGSYLDALVLQRVRGSWWIVHKAFVVRDSPIESEVVGALTSDSIGPGKPEN